MSLELHSSGSFPYNHPNFSRVSVSQRFQSYPSAVVRPLDHSSPSAVVVPRRHCRVDLHNRGPKLGPMPIQCLVHARKLSPFLITRVLLITTRVVLIITVTTGTATARCTFILPFTVVYSTRFIATHPLVPNIPTFQPFFSSCPHPARSSTTGDCLR